VRPPLRSVVVLVVDDAPLAGALHVVAHDHRRTGASVGACAAHGAGERRSRAGPDGPGWAPRHLRRHETRRRGPGPPRLRGGTDLCAMLVPRPQGLQGVHPRVETVAIRLVSPRALEARCAVLEHRACVRWRIHRCKARSTRGLSRGAPTTERHRLRGSQWPCREALAFPHALWGSPRRSSTCWSSPRGRSSMIGRREAWWYAQRAAGLICWSRASASWSNTCLSASMTTRHAGGNTAARALHWRRPWARQWQRIRWSASAAFRESASDMTNGLPRCAWRCAQRAVRFAPAGDRPASERPRVRSPTRTTKAVVYMPVRSFDRAMPWVSACACAW